MTPFKIKNLKPFGYMALQFKRTGNNERTGRTMRARRSMDFGPLDEDQDRDSDLRSATATNAADVPSINSEWGMSSYDTPPTRESFKALLEKFTLPPSCYTLSGWAAKSLEAETSGAVKTTEKTFYQLSNSMVKPPAERQADSPAPLLQQDWMEDSALSPDISSDQASVNFPSGRRVQQPSARVRTIADKVEANTTREEYKQTARLSSHRHEPENVDFYKNLYLKMINEQRGERGKRIALLRPDQTLWTHDRVQPATGTTIADVMRLN